MFKNALGSEDWFMMDTMRGSTVSNQGARLSANTSAAEVSTDSMWPIATGFSYNVPSASTYIYCAIRRPDQTPVNSSEVYKGAL